MSNNELLEKFTEIFKTQIIPKAKKLETYRLKERKKYCFFTALILIFIVLILISCFLCSKNYFPSINNLLGPVFVASVIIIIISVIMANKISNDFRKTVKSLLLLPILSVFGEFQIKKDNVLTLNEIKSAGLYPKADHKKDDDIIRGIYKNHIITFIETELSHSEKENNSFIQIGASSSTKKEKRYRTVKDFKGLIIKIGLNTSFDVSVAGIQHNKFDLSSIFDSTVYLGRKLEKMNTNNPYFSSYEIYSDNKQKFESVLTQSFSNNLNKIREILSVASINFILKDNSLYLFLEDASYRNNFSENAKFKFFPAPDKGFFEVGSISKTLIDKNIYIKTFKELIAIFSVVNCFIENNKTKTDELND